MEAATAVEARSSMGALFTIGSRISRKSLLIMGAGQLFLLFLIWLSHPLKMFPGPVEVFTSMKELWFVDGLAVELINSFVLNAEAIAITTVLSLTISYGSEIPFFRIVAWCCTKLRFASMVGLTYFVTLYTPNGHALKLTLMVFVMSTFFIASMYDVIRATLQEERDYGKLMFRYSWSQLRETIIYPRAGEAFDILRQVAAMGWAMLSLVEGYARSGGGVGVMLADSNKHLNIDKIVAIQIVIITVGIAIDWAIGKMKFLCCEHLKFEQGGDK